MSQHQKFLLLALQQAEKGRGFCAPNPAVGAVVVKQNQVLAVGYHHGAGLSHAEVEAINQLSATECEQADIYITLEPCSHYGRTPPCADLLIQKKFHAVYYGFQDPNPRVAGRGAEKILAAGIHCEFIEVPEIALFYRSYDYWTRTHKPYITSKLAISLDGKIAAAGGASIKLTHAAADQYTHLQRVKTDAILSTVKTVVQDNPSLNARIENQIYPKKVFLIDSQQQLSNNAKLFQTAAEIVLYTEKQKNNLNPIIQQIRVSRKNSGLDLKAIITDLGNRGLHDVWVEAGASLNHALLQQKLVNRLIIYISPMILGSDALPAFIDQLSLPTPLWQKMGIDMMAEFIF